jgi:hypothetical protein
VGRPRRPLGARARRDRLAPEPHRAGAHPFALTGFGIAGETAALKEKREKLAEKAKLWTEADSLSLVDGKRDMSRKPLLEKLGVEDAASAKSVIDALYFEIEELNQTSTRCTTPR